MQPTAFKLTAYWGMASYTTYADVKRASGLLFSGCGIWFLFSISTEDSALRVYP